MRFYRIRKLPTRLIFFIIACLVIFLNPWLRSRIKGFAVSAAYLPARLIENIKLNFSKTERLNRENLDLKRRLGELTVEFSRMKEKERRIGRLEELLGFKKSLRYKAEASRVIARDTSGLRKFLVIDKGSSSGIRENSPCVSLKGIVGNVVESSGDTSKVMLITDPASRIGVKIAPSGDTGLLVGSSNGACRVIYLGLDSELGEGDEVVTSGVSSLFPEGLPVGRVNGLGIERTKLYRYAEIDPYAELNRVKEVLILNGGER